MKKYNFFFCHSFLKTFDEKIRYLMFLWRSDRFTRFYLTERYQNGSYQGLQLQFLGLNVWKMEFGQEVQLNLFETVNINLECPYRLNQKDWRSKFIPLVIAIKKNRDNILAAE